MDNSSILNPSHKVIVKDYDHELQRLWSDHVNSTDSIVLSKAETHSFSERNQSLLNPRRGRQ